MTNCECEKNKIKYFKKKIIFTIIITSKMKITDKNYQNKVAFVQSEDVFDKNARMEYLKIKKSQLLTSTDEEEIFDFIKNHASKNGIYHFVLHNDSETLRKLILHMYEKKRSSKKTRSLLEKCKLVATNSNTDSVRFFNEETNVRIMFAVSPLSEVLASCSDGSASSSTEPNNKEVMVVVSDTVSSYYTQIYNHFDSEETTLVKYKASQVTIELLNEFDSNGGNEIVLALDTEAEYDAFGQKIDDSDYKHKIHIIECTQLQSVGMRKMQLKVSDIQISSSGVCINAPGNAYPGLNSVIPYSKTAALLTKLWKSWDQLEDAKILVKSEREISY